MNKPKWEVLKAGRSWSNESNGAEMAGCISEGGRVVAYLPNHFKDAPLLCAAPELLEALEACVEYLNMAFNSEGDCFGVQHNNATDALSAAEVVISKAKGGA